MAAHLATIQPSHKVDFTNNSAGGGGAMYTNRGGLSLTIISFPTQQGQEELYTYHIVVVGPQQQLQTLFTNNVASHRCGAVLYENCGQLTVVNSHSATLTTTLLPVTLY